MKKVLFLDTDTDDFGVFFRKEREKVSKVKSMKLYKDMNPFTKRVLIWLGLHIHSIFLMFIYGEWKNQINEYDIFVLPSRKSIKRALKILEDKKVIIYYWNIITDKEINPQKIRKKNITLCTFDRGDSEKYNLNYVDTYYFDIKKENYTELVDVFYIGIKRNGRQVLLDNLAKHFNENGISYNFHLVDFDDYNNRLSYEEVIENIVNCKVILDLTREGQKGLTLRPLEAMFFNKKLITNNKDIINYDFYNKNNIFILGKDDINNITNFVYDEIEEISFSIKKEYLFENWLEKVINCEEKNMRGNSCV